jgi:hypothetical protein
MSYKDIESDIFNLHRTIIQVYEGIYKAGYKKGLEESKEADNFLDNADKAYQVEKDHEATNQK